MKVKVKYEQKIFTLLWQFLPFI